MPELLELPDIIGLPELLELPEFLELPNILKFQELLKIPKLPEFLELPDCPEDITCNCRCSLARARFGTRSASPATSATGTWTPGNQGCTVNMCHSHLESR